MGPAHTVSSQGHSGPVCHLPLSQDPRDSRLKGQFRGVKGGSDAPPSWTNTGMCLPQTEAQVFLLCF